MSIRPPLDSAGQTPDLTITRDEPTVSPADADRIKKCVREMNHAEFIQMLRHGREEEISSLLTVLKDHSGEIHDQIALALVDVLAIDNPRIQEMVLDIIVSRNKIALMAMKIAFELRERALYQDEIEMPLNQVIQIFNETPVMGKDGASTALAYVKAYQLNAESKDEFEERFQYFTRDEPTVSAADLAERKEDKTACRSCGNKMTIERQGPYYKLRCNGCDITRFEKTI